MLSANEELNAEQAKACGLLNDVIDDATAAAHATQLARSIAGLDPIAMRTMLSITSEPTDDADLADLVRSIARPGIHARIARYREAAR